MTNPTISISNAPAKTVAIKPPGNDGAARQDAQSFGNVLSRQLADSAKPAESSPTEPGPAEANAAAVSSSSADAGRPQPAQNTATTKPAAEPSSDLPADIMAALLAQQNHAAATQNEPNALSVQHAQTTTETSDAASMVAATPVTADRIAGMPEAKPKATGASLALISGNDTAKPWLADDGATLPQIEGAGKGVKNLTDTFKAALTKEMPANSQTLPASVISEAATPSLQSGNFTLLPTAAATSGNLSISTAINQPAWGDEFAQKITWIATQRNQSAELHLNPPQLGPVDVVLKMNGDQATALFTSPHAAVRDAIEQAIPKLREMMAENGIMLGQAMVSDHSAKQDQDNASNKTPVKSPNSALNDVTEQAGIQELHVSAVSRHNGMVDTFA